VIRSAAISAPPFAGLTGKGVRVAVIDSGVNAAHPHIHGITGGAGIREGGEIVPGYLDILGHGTAVMAAIQEKAPEAEYFAVQLFQTSLSTSAELVSRAVDWAIDEGMDVINLSLGTCNPDHRLRFEALVERSRGRGAVLVSARQAGEGAALPGSLPGVIGAGLDWNCGRDFYRVETCVDGEVFYVSGYPRPLPGVSPERNLRGISFAVANLTGFVIRAYGRLLAEGGRPDVDSVRKALLAEVHV
jgi:subtilisin family serine protease